MTDLTLFNSLTSKPEVFVPVHEGEARVYTCGPTVYNYPHIGNMRAYVFADVLGRTLSYKGFKLTHIINITDVGHLTDDADEGEDKMEKMAAEKAQSIWDIAQHYTQAYWADVIRDFLGLDKERYMFFCGMAIGYRDPDAPVNNFERERVPLDEQVRFLGWD